MAERDGLSPSASVEKAAFFPGIGRCWPGCVDSTSGLKEFYLGA